MDAIGKAAELYKVKLRQENQSFPTNNDALKQDQEIQRYLSAAVRSVPSTTNIFAHFCISNSLIESLLVCVFEEKDIMRVENAYTCLEKYFRLLIEQPWKPEYRILKTYGGYYRTKIKSVLRDAETIFTMAGYVQEHNNTLVYTRSDVDNLLSVSFDCFVASEICKKIAKRFDELKTVGKTLNDAANEILKDSWPPEQVTKNYLSSHKKSAKLMPTPGLFQQDSLNGLDNKRVHAKEVIYPSEPFPMNDLRKQSITNIKHKSHTGPHIQFMDDTEHYPNLSQATSEEHMLESVKRVQQQTIEHISDGRSRPLPNMSNVNSACAYPPGKQLYAVRNSDSKDEGIGLGINLGDKTNSSMHSSYTDSIMPPDFSDQGYLTDQPYIPSPPPDRMMSDQIYHPPNLAGDMKKSQAAVARTPDLPPPIPRRDLKPKMSLESGVDVVNGHPKPCSTNYIPQISTLSSPLQPNIRLPVSIAQMRSRSLKTEVKKPFIDNRVSKSMDCEYNQWRCLGCNAPNSASLERCSTCSTQRYNILSEEQKKVCTMCTLLNNWYSKVCEGCESEL